MKKLSAILLLLVLGSQSFAQNTENYRMVLKDDWQMQSALKVQSAGNGISQPQFKPTGWYKVSVPTTIIAGLVANKAYDFDPFYGMNFEKLKDPSLDKPWWFRKEFALPASEKDKNVVLKLHGINYK